MIPTTPDFTIGGQPVYVEQGPVWLARFLVAPPWWFKAVVFGAGAAVLVAAGYRLATDGVDDETKAEVVRRAIRLGSVVATTWAFSRFGPLPYVADVVAGAALGLLIGIIVDRYTKTFGLARTAAGSQHGDVS